MDPYPAERRCSPFDPLLKCNLVVMRDIINSIADKTEQSYSNSIVDGLEAHGPQALVRSHFLPPRSPVANCDVRGLTKKVNSSDKIVRADNPYLISNFSRETHRRQRSAETQQHRTDASFGHELNMGRMKQQLDTAASSGELLRNVEPLQLHSLGGQVSALSQALVGLAAFAFEWSSNMGILPCREMTDRILQYCSPCAFIDVDLQEICCRLRSIQWPRHEGSAVPPLDAGQLIPPRFHEIATPPYAAVASPKTFSNDVHSVDHSRRPLRSPERIIASGGGVKTRHPRNPGTAREEDLRALRALVGKDADGASSTGRYDHEVNSSSSRPADDVAKFPTPCKEIDVDLLKPHALKMLHEKNIFSDEFYEEHVVDLLDEYFPVGNTVLESDSKGIAELSGRFLRACVQRRVDLMDAGKDIDSLRMLIHDLDLQWCLPLPNEETW